MKTLNDRYQYGLELFLLSIDEGITGYRDDSVSHQKPILTHCLYCFITDCEKESTSILYPFKDSILCRAVRMDHGWSCCPSRKEEQLHVLWCFSTTSARSGSGDVECGSYSDRT